jgi:hypothetical protein
MRGFIAHICKLQASLKNRQLDNKPTETEDENANASQN